MSTARPGPAEFQTLNFNKRAEAINVRADNSGAFLGMTWAAVAAVLLVLFLWCAICCCGSHRGNTRGSKNDGQTKKIATRVEEARAREESTDSGTGYGGPGAYSPRAHAEKPPKPTSGWGRWRR